MNKNNYQNIFLGNEAYNTVISPRFNENYGRNLLENYLDSEDNENVDYSSVENSSDESSQYDNLEKTLREEWEELEIDESNNWFEVIGTICQTILSEFENLDEDDGKINSWFYLYKTLSEFREAEISENNAIFEKFLSTLKESRLTDPKDYLNYEEEKIWNEIKELKQEKDSEWNKYHIGTWKYWFQKEFPTIEIHANI
ncbi:ring-exported protein 3, putative [Plasmodium ovale]|uniref:Ring-exported protein 3, putative n=1 Tax=Plasmodium ovale TaxID=36330 RepID=A0A1C3KJM4_PLAOA|nr:ring-exported protein 3, putative [Plasmodium ovale]